MVEMSEIGTPPEVLRAYAKEDLKKPDLLPEKLSSVNQDIEATDRLRLDVVLEEIAKNTKAIKAATSKRFVVMGSRAIYALMNQHRQEEGDLMALERRIAGGKNDFDIGVNPAEFESVMNDFSWHGENRAQNRGSVGEVGGIDLNSRAELKDFPWVETEVNGEKVLVQSPEEMILEKVDALVSPGRDDSNQEREREVKWGIDIKLLKAHLALTTKMDDSQLEGYLGQKWNTYIDQKYLGQVLPIIEAVKNGMSAEISIASLLNVPPENVATELTKMSGESALPIINDLLDPNKKDQFRDNMAKFAFMRLGRTNYDYPQASSIAIEEFNKIVASTK